MTVKSESLDNAERDLELLNRETKSGKRVATATITQDEALTALTALRQRIAEGLAATPTAPIPECAACYRKGWMAALKSLEE